MSRLSWTTVRARLQAAAFRRQRANEILAAHYAAHGFPSVALHERAAKATERYWFWDKKARTYPQFTARPAVPS